MFVPGCMWQTMHWLEGMERVNWCLIGCPDSFFGMVGSTVAASAKVAVDSSKVRMLRRTIVGVDYVASAATAGCGSRRADHLCLGRQQRIEQPRFLQAEKKWDRCAALFRTRALPVLRRACRVPPRDYGIPTSGFFSPPRSKTRRTLPG